MVASCVVDRGRKEGVVMDSVTIIGPNPLSNGNILHKVRYETPAGKLS